MRELELRTRIEQMAAIRIAQAAQAAWLEHSGLSFDYSSADGQAGLHGATFATEVTHWLAKGAPIDGVQRITSYSDRAEHWETPLLTALVDGHLDVARELINRGADVDAMSMVVEQTIDGALTISALHMMVSRRNRAAVDLLLGAGANVNLRSSDGTTPIWFAAEKDDFSGVSALIRAGAEIDVLDFKGRRPADGAGPMTRDLLKTASPIKKWQMDTLPATALFPTVRDDLDFEQQVNVRAPEGWRRPSDFTEAFLVAAALEYQERLKVNRIDPWSNETFKNLPVWCKYDSLKDLCAFGGRVDAETSGQTGLSQFEIAADFARGEVYSRFPLLQLLWEYLDEVLPRVIGQDRDYYSALERLEGKVFGKLGTALFLSALPQVLRGDDQLSSAEARFAAGREFRTKGLNGVATDWKPFSGQNVDSIWQVCFRLIEANSPEYYLRKFAHRVPAISALLREGGRLGELHRTWPYPYQHQNSWPGWDYVIANSKGNPVTQWINLDGKTRTYKCSMCDFTFRVYLEKVAQWLAITRPSVDAFFLNAIDEYMNLWHVGKVHPTETNAMVHPVKELDHMGALIHLLPDMPKSEPPAHLEREEFVYALPSGKFPNAPREISLLAVWDSSTLARFRQTLTQDRF